MFKFMSYVQDLMGPRTLPPSWNRNEGSWSLNWCCILDLQIPLYINPIKRKLVPKGNKNSYLGSCGGGVVFLGLSVHCFAVAAEAAAAVVRQWSRIVYQPSEGKQLISLVTLYSFHFKYISGHMAVTNRYRS